jgi:type III secretion system (T3SS) inner membrane Yop/YscD-like protein
MDAENLQPRAASRVAGELVLQSGPRAGARQPLNTPTTFIGREQGCDVRLNVDNVDPLHCLLIVGVDGVRIRDLNTQHGTFVNGVRTHHLQLQDGDVVNVGPFQFRIELTAIPATDDPERDALRIQIAAVAAQQVALDDEETRLHKRKADLEQQEEQLAAHLAAKQQQIETDAQKLEEEREALRVARLEQQARAEKADTELALSKDSLARDHHHVTLERQRVNRIYHRLRQRWQKHWSAEKEKLRRLTSEVAAERKELQQIQAAARERESVLSHESLRFKAERELCMRQIYDERTDLAKDQEQWRRRRSLELAALNTRQQDLDDAQARLAQARQLLADERTAWVRQQEMLEKELHGLNNRIVHQRVRLQEQADEIASLEARRRELLAEIPEATLIEYDVEVLGEAGADPRLINLEQLAGDLADQRMAMLEQYERVVQFHRCWHEDHARAAEELDALARRLAAEEQDIVARQAQTHQAEEALQSRQQEIASMRQEIAIYHAQLRARQQLLEDEHATELAALREKGELLNEQLAGLAEVRLRWNNRRQEEIAQLQASRAALAGEQAETHAQRTQLFAAGQEIAEEKRLLTEKSLALEQYRQKVFQRVKDPAAAKKRVWRLRRRWLSLHAALDRHARNEREAAEIELERIEVSRAQLREELSRLSRLEAALTEKQILLEESEAALKAQRIQMDDEMRKLTYQQQAPERHNLLMREDAEAVARVVFEESAPPHIDRAA